MAMFTSVAPIAATSRGDLIDTIAPAAAKAGARVTLTVKGFGALLVRITVGGAPATIVSLNTHRVTFVVPRNARPGPTTVVAKSLLGRSDSIAFTVLDANGGGGGGGGVSGPPRIVSEETARAATATITEQGGGAITTTAANGTVYTLSVPAGAVQSDTAITITPIAAVSPFSGAPVAVRMQPSGLQLLRPAILEITPPGTVGTSTAASASSIAAQAPNSAAARTQGAASSRFTHWRTLWRWLLAKYRHHHPPDPGGPGDPGDPGDPGEPTDPGTPTDRTLGFIFNDDGTNFEVLPVDIDGSTMTIEIEHFSAAGTAGASPADFAAIMQPLLAALPPTLPPSQVDSLISTMLSWIEPSAPGGLPHFELCTATTLCQQVLQIAAQSLAQHQAQACGATEALIQAREPFLARAALDPVIGIAGRLVEIGALAAQAGVPGFDTTFDLACVAESLADIIQLAREEALATGRTSPLVLLAEIFNDAALLDLTSEQAAAQSAFAEVIEAFIARASQACLTDPAAGEGIVMPLLIGFSDDFLNAFGSNLNDDVERTFAECRIRITPDPATVGTGQTLQFTGSAIGLSDPSVTWSVDGGGTIDPVTGLFMAGPVGGTFAVTATSVVPPAPLPAPRVTEPVRQKTMDVTVVNVQVIVNPGNVTLVAGATRQFAVIVTGLSNLDVVWTASSGTIDPQTGFFTAPQTPGVVRVRATSVAAPVFGEAVVNVIVPNGRITAFNHLKWIGACASADAQVLTSGFGNPAMTLSIQGPGVFLNRILINTTTFMTVRANNDATGTIVVTATSVENPSVTATATWLVDPFVAAYGGGTEGSGFVVRGADAGVPDDQYRIGLQLTQNTSGVYFVSGDAIKTGSASNGNTLTVTLGSTAMQGTVTTPDGTRRNFLLSRNCAPLPAP